MTREESEIVLNKMYPSIVDQIHVNTNPAIAQIEISTKDVWGKDVIKLKKIGFNKYVEFKKELDTFSYPLSMKKGVISTEDLVKMASDLGNSLNKNFVKQLNEYIFTENDFIYGVKKKYIECPKVIEVENLAECFSEILPIKEDKTVLCSPSIRQKLEDEGILAYSFDEIEDNAVYLLDLDSFTYNILCNWSWIRNEEGHFVLEAGSENRAIFTQCGAFMCENPEKQTKIILKVI